jgi:hypothetical protein
MPFLLLLASVQAAGRWGLTDALVVEAAIMAPLRPLFRCCLYLADQEVQVEMGLLPVSPEVLVEEGVVPW